MTPDIVPIEDDPAPSSNKSLQNVPVADTAAISKGNNLISPTKKDDNILHFLTFCFVVPEKQKKQSVKAQKRPRNHIPDVTSLPFTLASAEEEVSLREKSNFSCSLLS